MGDLACGVMIKLQVGDELAVCGFLDAGELAGGVVGYLVRGAVGADGAGEPADPIILVGRGAACPVGDGGQEVTGVVGVVDLLAVGVGQAGEVVVGIVAVLDEVAVGVGVGFQPTTFVVAAADGGGAFGDSF